MMHDYGPAADRLKRMREMTEPRLSVRATAEALGMPSSSYAAYEDSKRFKKSVLPLPLAMQIVELFERHGVARQLTMTLAGLDEKGEVQRTPEALADELDAVLLPEIDVGYSMGGGADVTDYPIVTMVPLSRAWLRSLTDSPASHLYVARGDGDSMMPTLLDQDIVIIDRAQRILNRQDRIWALAYGGFGMIKRVRGLPSGLLQVNSDNPAVSPIEATEEECHIIGRVVGVIRKM